MASFLKCITVLLTHVHLAITLRSFSITWTISCPWPSLFYAGSNVVGINLQLQTSENPTQDGLSQKEIVLTMRTGNSRVSSFRHQEIHSLQYSRVWASSLHLLAQSPLCRLYWQSDSILVVARECKQLQNHILVSP